MWEQNFSDDGARSRLPLFFIGCSPSQAKSIINPESPAAGVMISMTQLRKRQSDFQVDDWILDSGAFTEIARHGAYRFSVEEYHKQICRWSRWSRCGNLLAAVAQDWMCEPKALARTGLNVPEHQRLTISRYDQLFSLEPPVPIMPVPQGYRSSDYLKHLQDYGAQRSCAGGDRLALGSWVGVGSVCRRKNCDEIVNLLRTIKLIRPDLKLHGFGLKMLALSNHEIRDLLHSCDSTAWSYPNKFKPVPEPEIELAHQYQEKVTAAKNGFVRKRVPRTAGAGNGQGRKPQWKAGKTKPIRVPEKFAEELLAIAHRWDDQNDHEIASDSPSKNGLVGDTDNRPSKNVSPSSNNAGKRPRGFGGSGSIYWRTVTRNNKDYRQPYYHWRDGGRKRTKYIPKRLLGQVIEAVDQKLPVASILEILGVVLPSDQELLGENEVCPSKGNCPSKTDTPSTKSSKKKQRVRGKGNGYIHWRLSQGKYKQAYYHYEIWENGERKIKSSKYIPKRLLAKVQMLDEGKAPVREILKVLGVKKQ